jgi:hypothetical protein
MLRSISGYTPLTSSPGPTITLNPTVAMGTFTTREHCACAPQDKASKEMSCTEVRKVDVNLKFIPTVYTF